MSEIRKALDLIKRVERLEDKGARRLALELGTVACERAEQQERSSSAKLESEGEKKQEQHCSGFLAYESMKPTYFRSSQ